MHGVDSMPETAENVARPVRDRPRVAGPHGPGLATEGRCRSESGLLRRRADAGDDPAEEGEAVVVAKDEHPRETSMEALARLKGVVRPDGTVTAGQCLRRQRRRLRAAAGQRGGRRPARPDPARPHRRAWPPSAWRRASWASAGSCYPQGAGADRAQAGADGRDRAERGLRGPGPGGAARPSASMTTTRASTRTAARSRWAIRSAPAAHGW